MDRNEESTHIVARHWKPVTLLSLIGLIPALVAGNNWYENWHIRANDARYVQIAQAEERYARKADVIELAKVEDMQNQVIQIEQNVDFLVKSAAVQAVDRIKNELTVHSFQDDGSQLWRKRKTELENRLYNAEAYRTCLFQSGSQNCDASRVW